MSTETFKDSGIYNCAYCKKAIDVNDRDTLVMSLSRFIGIEQNTYDAMACEQKIVTQGLLINIIFHRKCLIEFFKNSTINITKSMIDDIGVSYPMLSDRSEQIKMLMKKRGKLK